MPSEGSTGADEPPTFRLERFEYVRMSDDTAVLRLAGDFAAIGVDPADPLRLVVDDGSAVRELTPVPRADGMSAISAKNGPMRAAFYIPVDVLDAEAARYMLASGTGWGMDLPPPMEKVEPSGAGVVNPEPGDSATHGERPNPDGNDVRPLAREADDVRSALSTARAEADAELEVLATIEQELRARTESQRAGRMALQRHSDELRALREHGGARRPEPEDARRAEREGAREARLEQLRAEALRGAREIAELENRIAEIRDLLSARLGADPARSRRVASDEMVVVKRSWASSERLEVPLVQLTDFRFTASTGIGKGIPTRPILAATMPCTAIPDGADFDHDCSGEDRPHRIEVLIFKSRNDDETYARMEALAEGS